MSFVLHCAVGDRFGCLTVEFHSAQGTVPSTPALCSSRAHVPLGKAGGRPAVAIAAAPLRATHIGISVLRAVRQERWFRQARPLNRSTGLLPSMSHRVVPAQ